MQLTKDCSDILWRRYEVCVIRGKVEPVMLYEALDHDGGAIPVWFERYHQALEQFEAKAFQAAEALFAEASELREGGDSLSLKFKVRCKAERSAGSNFELGGRRRNAVFGIECCEPAFKNFP